MRPTQRRPARVPPVVGAMIWVAALAALTLTALVVSACGSSPEEKQERAVQRMDWCHELGGAYSGDVTSSGGPRFTGAPGRCEIPPPSAPEGCYTPRQDAPPGVPSGVNWYAYYLLDKGGAGAGGLDEYAHCKGFAVVSPAD